MSELLAGSGMSVLWIIAFLIVTNAIYWPVRWVCRKLRPPEPDPFSKEYTRNFPMRRF